MASFGINNFNVFRDRPGKLFNQTMMQLKNYSPGHFQFRFESVSQCHDDNVNGWFQFGSIAIVGLGLNWPFTELTESFVRQRPRLQQNDLGLAIREIPSTNGLTSRVVGVMLPLQARSNLTNGQDSGISPPGSWEFAMMTIHWINPVARTSREDLLILLGTLTPLPWTGLSSIKNAVEANGPVFESHALLQSSLPAGAMGFKSLNLINSSVLKLSCSVLILCWNSEIGSVPFYVGFLFSLALLQQPLPNCRFWILCYVCPGVMGWLT